MLHPFQKRMAPEGAALGLFGFSFFFGGALKMWKRFEDGFGQVGSKTLVKRPIPRKTSHPTTGVQ
jgi:hypothetical protein